MQPTIGAVGAAFQSFELTYDFCGLKPAISDETVMHHFFQHHRASYERTAALVAGTELDGLSLESLVRVSATRPGYAHLYRYAADAWNHDLYRNSLRPAGGGPAYGPIGEHIRHSFGSFPRFLRRAKEAATAVAGSGWLWVTWHAGDIELVTTDNSDTPIVRDQIALLAIDLWEHAYYLDYFDGRAAYVSACFERLINWDFANERLFDLTDRSGIQKPVLGMQDSSRAAKARPNL